MRDTQRVCSSDGGARDGEGDGGRYGPEAGLHRLDPASNSEGGSRGDVQGGYL